MSNTTPIYWDVDGNSLNTLAYNIETLGGERDGVPPFRGENRPTPYRPGARHSPKMVDQRGLVLLMWSRDTDVDGVQPATEALRLEQMMTNRRTIKNWFWRDDASQVTLTKRWYESGSIISAAAKVQLNGSMAPDMHGPYEGKFSVDLLMADPFFYRTLSTVTLSVGVAQSVTNPGDARTTGRGSKIRVNGPLTNPIITNATPNPDIWLKLGTSIATGDWVDVDLENWTVTRNSDGANLIGTVTHSGAHQLMLLLKGTNSLTLTTSSGTGTAVLNFDAPYL